MKHDRTYTHCKKLPICRRNKLARSARMLVAINCLNCHVFVLERPRNMGEAVSQRSIGKPPDAQQDM